MENAKKTLILLDGNALLHRAWHAIPPLMTKDGLVVNAAYGFAVILEKILSQMKPDYMAVAWDLKGATFRHEAYEPYKAHREEKAQELYDQIPLIQELLTAFGVPSYSAKGFEADDVIATLAAKAAKKGIRSRIVTGDLDALQLVDDDTEVVFFQKGISETKTYDEAAVRERYGFAPAQLIDYKALRGDPSDNLPGVSGIGEKTGTELVVKHGSVDGILKALVDGSMDEKLAKKLRGHEETLRQMRHLVAMARDIDLPFRPDDMEVHPPIWERILPLYRRFEFRTLLRKHEGMQATPPPLPKRAGRKGTRAVDAPVASARNAKEDEAALDALARETVGVLAVEQPRDLFGATLSAVVVSDGTKSVLLLNPDAERLQKAFAWLDGAKRVVAHDLKRLMHATRWEPTVRAEDTMVGSYLLHAGSRAHDFASCVSEHLNIALPELPASCSTEAECQAHARAAALLPALFQKVLDQLREQGMEKVYADIEMPLVPVLFGMERAGVEVDGKALERFGKELRKRLEELTDAIHAHAGEPFNINSPSQLATVLFERLNLPTKGVKKTQKGFSTAAPELEKLMEAHPIVPHIGEYRELEKLRSTYAESLPGLVREDGRVHTTFNQTVAATGRLSSTDPNLQNIPIKTELGNRIREAFVAPRGRRLVAVDYSQIELRLVAVIAEDKPFIEAFRAGADIHTRTAAEVWEIPEEKVTPEQRRAAKAINFGIIYGMGARSLARSTGMSHEEAQQFIERYFSIHHAVRAYLDGTKALAHTQGFVETRFGRRRSFPEIESGIPQLVAAAERMAINMPVQGTAADIVKMAMITVDGWLKKSGWPARLILQVHDELVVECDAKVVDAVAKGMRELMEGVANFEVPLAVDVEVGDNWGEMEAWGGE